MEQVNTITMLLRVMMSLMTTPHYHLVLKQQTQKGLSKVGKFEFETIDFFSTKSNAPGAALWKVMKKMTGPGKVINPHPDDNPERRLLNVKYKVFLEQCYSQRKFRDMVDKIELENAELAKTLGLIKLKMMCTTVVKKYIFR